MALNLTCSCGCRMSVDESSAGKKVQCPLCQRMLVPSPGQPGESGAGASVRQGPPPLPGSAGDEIMTAHPAVPTEVNVDKPVAGDRPRKKKARQKERLRQEKRLLRTVGRGLTLIYWGIICLLICLVIRTAIILVVGSVFFVSWGHLDLLRGGQVLSDLLQNLTILMCFAGSVLCCWVPSQSRARGIMITSAALDGTAFGFALTSLILAVGVAAATDVNTAITGTRLGMAFTVVSLLLRLAGFLLFFFFFRNFAEYLEDRGIASASMEIMGKWIWLTIAGIVVFVVGGSMALTLGCFGVLVFLLAFGVWFTFYVKQWIRVLNLIAAMKNTLAFKWGV